MLSPELESFTKTYHLADLIDFVLPTFNLCINPNAKIQNQVQSSYPLVRLNDKSKFALSIGRRVLSSEVSDNGLYPVYSANVKEAFGKINKLLTDDFSCDSILWGIDGDWMVSYIPKNQKYYPTDHCGVLKVLDDNIEPYYVALALEIVGSSYGFSRTYRASTERISSVQIPIPPSAIQKQIVQECNKIDEEFQNSRMTISTYREKIQHIFDELEIVKKSKSGGVIQLNKIASYQTGRVPYGDIQADSYISTENMLQDCEGVIPYDGNPNTNSVIEYQKGDILVSNIRPYLQKIWLADRRGGCNPDVLVIRIDDVSKYDPEFVYYTLRRKAFFDHMMTDKSGVKMPRGNKVNNLRFAIPDIPLQEQREILSTVLEMEHEIVKAKETMVSAQKRKHELLNRYLFS